MRSRVRSLTAEARPTRRDGSTKRVSYTRRTSASLDNFARAYRDCPGEIETARPKPAAIDVLPAVPAVAAFTLGRGLMRDAQPVWAACCVPRCRFLSTG